MSQYQIAAGYFLDSNPFVYFKISIQVGIEGTDPFAVGNLLVGAYGHPKMSGAIGIMPIDGPGQHLKILGLAGIGITTHYHY
jgi:hypothetical protein